MINKSNVDFGKHLNVYTAKPTMWQYITTEYLSNMGLCMFGFVDDLFVRITVFSQQNYCLTWWLFPIENSKNLYECRYHLLCTKYYFVDNFAKNVHMGSVVLEIW